MMLPSLSKHVRVIMMSQQIIESRRQKDHRKLYCPRCGRFLFIEGVVKGYLKITCKNCKTTIEVDKEGSNVLITCLS